VYEPFTVVEVIHAFLASPFLASIIVYTCVLDTDVGSVLVKVQVQVRSFLQDAKEATANTAIKNIFFMILDLNF
jgi:hypothetical protein